MITNDDEKGDEGQYARLLNAMGKFKIPREGITRSIDLLRNEEQLVVARPDRPEAEQHDHAESTIRSHA